MFDLSIYPSFVIREAVEDFREVAVIDSEFDQKHCQCRILSSVYDVDLTEKEFANYVLDKTASRGSMP